MERRRLDPMDPEQPLAGEELRELLAQLQPSDVEQMAHERATAPTPALQALQQIMRRKLRPNVTVTEQF